MKQCSTCGEWKDDSEFRARIRQCRECGRAKSREYHRINKASISEYKKSEQYKERKRELYRENPEKYRTYARKSQQKNHTRRAAYMHQYRLTHRADLYAYDKDYRSSHPIVQAKTYFNSMNITPTQELLDLKAKQIALVRAIRKQRKAEA